MGTSNFNLNAMHNGLFMVKSYQPMDKAEFIDGYGVEGTPEQLDEQYQEYVNMYVEADDALPDTLSNISYDLKAKGYDVYTEADNNRVREVRKDNKPVARLTGMPGYYTDAQIDVELLSDSDWVEELVEQGTMDLDDYVVDLAELKDVRNDDDEFVETLDEAWEALDADAYEAFENEVYKVIAKGADKSIVEVVKGYTTALTYNGSFSNGEALFSVAE